MSVSAVCLVAVLHLGYVVVVLMGWDGGRGSQRGMETEADERTCREGEEQTKSACVCLGAVRLCVCVCRLYAAVKVMFATAIFITYGLQFYVPLEILWPPLQRLLSGSSVLQSHGDYALRYAFLAVTCQYCQTF